VLSLRDRVTTWNVCRQQCRNSKLFRVKLVRFRQIWLDLDKIKAKFGQNWGETWAKVIRLFGQNQNHASPKTFDLLRYGHQCLVFRLVSCNIYIRFTCSKYKWLFWRAGFFLANQSSLNAFQIALNSWRKVSPPKNTENR